MSSSSSSSHSDYAPKPYSTRWERDVRVLSQKLSFPRFGSSDRLSTISSMSSSASLSHRPPVYPSSASSSLMSRSYGNPSTTSYSRASGEESGRFRLIESECNGHSVTVTRDTPSRSFTTTSSTGPSRDYSGFSSYRSSGTTGGGGYGTSSWVIQLICEARWSM